MKRSSAAAPDALAAEKSAAAGENALESKALVAFILPLALYLLINQFEPRFAPRIGTVNDTAAAAIVERQSLSQADTPSEINHAFDAKVTRYFWFGLAKTVLVGGVLIYFLPLYWRMLPWHFSWLAVAVGVVGCAVWIGICELQVENGLARALGLADFGSGSRSQMNPFALIASDQARTLFFGFRFLLLVAIVPMSEELFLRGFLMRFFQNPHWTRVGFNQLAWWPLATASIYGVLTHPSEMIAAAVWFSIVTWLMVKTNSFWNCVMAHAITNGLLGLYVVRFQQWHLW